MDEDWDVVASLFPADWRELGRSSGALRRLRGFASADDLLRVLLLHVAQGHSLRETAVLAGAGGLARVSDVALLKRFRGAGGWFRELCLRLLAETATTPAAAPGLVMQLVDATHVKEPGRTGSRWRIHYALEFPALRCRHLEVSPDHGPGVGESFRHFPAAAGDCLIGDRGYCTTEGVASIVGRGGHVIVRFNPLHMRLHRGDGSRFDVDAALAAWPASVRQMAWPCAIRPAAGEAVQGRLLAIRKSMAATEAAIVRVQRNAVKNQYTIRKPILEYAKYVMVFTTLPPDRLADDHCLEWYRLRWQIEIAFKRLKSLAELGHLPKRDPQSAQAWLYGKLLTSLLVEKLIRYGQSISPWGYDLPRPATMVEPLA